MTSKMMIKIHTFFRCVSGVGNIGQGRTMDMVPDLIELTNLVGEQTSKL